MKVCPRPGKRDKVFLDDQELRPGRQDHSPASRRIASRRLKTDHLDLWQFHEINYDNDADWIVEKGSGSPRRLKAQEAEGKVRFLGFTGHKSPHLHLWTTCCLRHHWDTCQMPINVLDWFYRSFAEASRAEGERGA